jgi:cell division protein FtsW
MTTKRQSKGEPDYVIIMITASLLALGLLMVYSASYVWAVATDKDPSYYFLRQCTWAALGIAGALLMYRVDHGFWRRWAIPIMAVVLLALLVVLFTGQRKYGAISTFLAGSIQPSEPAKVAMIIYLATWLSSKGEKLRDVSYGLLPFGILLGLVAGLIVLQPDLGAAILIVFIAIAMFFLAGADPKQVALSLGASVLTFALLFLTSRTAQQRITDFMAIVRDPQLRDPQQGGHPHVRMALEALAKGGMIGTGIPDGTYKQLGRVPLPFSDSIFPILGEEMGLLGTWLVLALFALLAYRGFRIALRAGNSYGMLLASGLTCWFIFQALINVAVNTAMVPYTGITLPFISHGGSSLVSCLAGVGLLLSISRGGDGGEREHEKRTRQKETTLHEALDFRRRDRGTRLSSSGRRGSTARRDGKQTRSSGSRTTKRRGTSRSTSQRRKGTSRSVRR